MKLISWNVNGLRAIRKKNFDKFLKKESPDILSLQETKIDKESVEQLPPLPVDYYTNYSYAEKKGYSGVANYTKKEPQKTTTKLGKKKFDSEGRFLVSEFKKVTLYNIYFPSGTTGDVRQDFKYKFLDFVYSYFKTKKITNTIICGDFNICHREIDIHHPDKATKLELSGFLPKERKWVDKFISLGFTDSFRYVHGDIKDKYSWWSYRAGARKKNLGWRIDYFFVSNDLRKKIVKADILSSVDGSDHAPLLLEIKI